MREFCSIATNARPACLVNVPTKLKVAVKEWVIDRVRLPINARLAVIVLLIFLACTPTKLKLAVIKWLTSLENAPLKLRVAVNDLNDDSPREKAPAKLSVAVKARLTDLTRLPVNDRVAVILLLITLAN